MPVYVVSYDLTLPGQNYAGLWNVLQTELQGQRVLLSQWSVRARGPASALRDYLTPHIDASDRLLVMDRDSGDWAGRNLMIRLDQY